MDRNELDTRIRSRRVDQPYRRGGYADEWDETGAPRYQPFEPEPEDALAQRGDPDAGAPQVVDNMGEQAADPWTPRAGAARVEPADPEAPAAEAPDPWRRGREVPDKVPRELGSLVPPIVPIAAPPQVDPAPTHEPIPLAPAAHPDPWGARTVEPPPAVEDPEYASHDEEGWPADEPYYVPADDDGPRRSSSALPIIGFVALGVIALLFGVFFSNLFGRDDPVARVTPTPGASASVAATVVPTETAAVSGSASPSGSGQPNASEGPPITFPDGFVAETQPCVSQPNENGCDSDGTTNDGNMWVYITFASGRREDVVGMTIVDGGGGVVTQASIELAELRCPANAPCNGWILFPGFGTPYSGLEPGEYRIRINRNGLPAAEASFTVT